MGFLAIHQQKHNKRKYQPHVIKGEYSLYKKEHLLEHKNIEPEINSLSLMNLNFALNEVTIARKNTTSMIGVQNRV